MELYADRKGSRLQVPSKGSRQCRCQAKVRDYAGAKQRFETMKVPSKGSRICRCQAKVQDNAGAKQRFEAMQVPSKGSRQCRCQAKLFRAHSIIQQESPCGKSMKMQNVIGVALKTELCSLSLSKLLAVLAPYGRVKVQYEELLHYTEVSRGSQEQVCSQMWAT